MYSFRAPTYFKVWLITATNALQQIFINRWTNILFLIGKAIRFIMSLVFLLIIKDQVTQFAGYTTDQLVVFFLVFQFVDTVAQVFYRGAYEFSNLIRTGEFDFYLSKPISPLFRCLTGMPDINDVLFLIPSTAVSIWIFLQLNIQITFISVLQFLLLMGNAMLIATGLHILIMAVGILIVDIDGLIWLYRDVSRMGRFPISIYSNVLQFALYILIPIGVMVSIPSQVLMSIEPSWTQLATYFFGIGFFGVSLFIWKHALRQYSGASS